jgi:hypothetical protein
MAYDRMGRRVAKNEEVFIYDNYLNICGTIWDPTEKYLSRALLGFPNKACDALLFHDGNKNVVSVIRKHRGQVSWGMSSYSPFGLMIGNEMGCQTRLPGFSSELTDREIGLTYYNFRHYNPTEGRAVDQLTSLLMPERYQQVRSQLRKRGFRSGFACLFHGAPGTGKTETVLQLARKTGRDLMQVNISEIKSMWVGESEKNIKAIFAQYRKLAEASKVAPILFFNEADAIIGKRLENVERSVDKMENSIQNIILEELEMLDGILIATTNLTCNMDKAFERRFLYKIEFAKPSLEAKSSIWLSMIPELKESDAEQLARKYDFSGGQIENIARKNVVDMILTGEQMSVEVLERHCDAELLAKPTLRKAIGY